VISPVEQNLIFAVAVVTILGSLTVLVWQWWRGRGRD
jgi:hypothetical protein